MPDSQKSKEIEKTEIVIDFDEAMKYPPIAVSTKKRRKKKERKMSKKLNLDRMKSVLRTQHGGPGPHKDGSSQDVHGKKSSGGGSRRRGGSDRPRPNMPAGEDVRPKGNTHYKGNLIIADWKPGHQDLLDRIDSRDTGEKLAYGFKVGDRAWATLQNGDESELGILRHYEDDNFYLDVDAGIIRVYKTKIHNEFD